VDIKFRFSAWNLFVLTQSTGKQGANMVQTSASQGLLGVVDGPAHGPRVDVVQLAACARARGALISLAILDAPSCDISSQQGWCRGRPPGFGATCPKWR
jgi:hypothetical protein